MRIDLKNKVGNTWHHVTIVCGLFLYLLTHYILNSNAFDQLNWLHLLIEVSTPLSTFIHKKKTVKK